MNQSNTRAGFGAELLAVSVAAMTSATALAEPAAMLVWTPVGSETDSLEETARDADAADGVLDVLLLSSTEESGGKFGQYLAVIFRDAAHRQAWAAMLEIAESDAIRVREADVLTHGEIWPRDSDTAIFQVNDYDPIVSSEAYDAFADGYIRPLMEGQVAADLMSRYSMFYEHGDDGLVWSVYEYVSQDAVDRTGEIKVGIRKTLTETDASYRDFDPTKDSLRIDGGSTTATAEYHHASGQ